MPIDYKKTVLIGDSDPERSALLVKIIQNDFRAKVFHVEFFDLVEAQVLEAVRAYTTWKLVLLAADLKESAKKPDPILPKHFYLAAQNNQLGVGCIYTDTDPPDENAVGYTIPPIHVPPPKSPGRDQRIIDNIREAHIGGLRVWKKPNVVPDEDPVLLEQVKGLSSSGEAENANDVLASLISSFLGESCTTVRVSKLIQGASGSKVFRFRPETLSSQANERVLKIVHYSQEWKLNEEVEKHIKAQSTLGNQYKGHVPEIEAVAGGNDNQRIASYYDWRALAYDFLGGPKFGKGGNRFGKFMDLETALIASHSELHQKTELTPFESYFATQAACANGRLHFLEVLLDWLSQNWYLGHSARKKGVLWDYSNGSDNSFGRFPPYQIPGRSKRYILNFLDSRKAQIGIRLFDGWEEYYETVRSFIAGKAEELASTYTLAAPQNVILSPSHGDLNSNNILLWLDESHPFLIDFPLYQESGHALQDFARLEVEVKFALMDRQEDSDPQELPAFDYTHSQIPLWQALEQHLLREHWDSGTLKLPSGAFEDNVRLSYELVKSIRTRAKTVQHQHKNKRTLGFWSEYRPALLYHTLRAIGYDSLSPFKRLLAVFSSAELLGQCRAKR